MPKLRRSKLPPAVLAHLLQRVAQRNITQADLMTLLEWIEGNPTVPSEPWFKRFGTFTICGEGDLILTFLRPSQTAVGTEVE